MGARQEVDAGRDPAQHAAQPAAPASRRPVLVCIVPVWTMRKAPSSARAGAGPAKSAASKPFVIETTIRVASSGKASTRRRAASGVFMTMAAALESWRRMRRRSTRWCRPRRVQPHLVEGPRVLEVGDPRDPELARERDRGLGGLVRDERGEDRVAVASGLAADGDRPVEPPPQQRVGPLEQAADQAGGAGGGRGLGARTRCTSARASPASASVGSSGVQRAACPPVPVTTTGVQPRSGRCSAKRRLRCTPPPPTGGKW